jgi:hypothetical protein
MHRFQLRTVLAKRFERIIPRFECVDGRLRKDLAQPLNSLSSIRPNIEDRNTALWEY